MSKGNFPNGALVSKIWRDGSGECIAKFQYFTDAVEWAEQKSKAPKDGGLMYVATCDSSSVK